MRSLCPSFLLSQFLLAMCLSAPGLVRADIAVIVHRDSPVLALSARQVSDLYLGRTRNIGSGELLSIYEHPVDSAAREKFFHDLNGMTLKQINAYWARLRFSGEVLPPISLSDDRALLSAVRRDRNAIAYVDTSVLDDSVRVVMVIK